METVKKDPVFFLKDVTSLTGDLVKACREGPLDCGLLERIEAFRAVIEEMRAPEFMERLLSLSYLAKDTAQIDRFCDKLLWFLRQVRRRVVGNEPPEEKDLERLESVAAAMYCTALEAEVGRERELESRSKVASLGEAGASPWLNEPGPKSSPESPHSLAPEPAPSPRNSQPGTRIENQHRQHFSGEKLTGWAEILGPLERPNTEHLRRRIKRYNELYGGPIVWDQRRPFVDKGALLAWWNTLEERIRALGNQRSTRKYLERSQAERSRSALHEEKRPNAKGRVR